MVGGQAQLQHRVVAAKDAGQDLGCEAAGEVEAVAGPQLGGQLAALLQGDGDCAVLLVRVEQVVLGQEAGEEQPVPVLVGGGLRQVVDGLGAGALVHPVAQGAPAGAQPVAEQALVHRHVAAVFVLVDGEVLQGGAGGGLGRLAGLLGDAGEEVALVSGERRGHEAQRVP